MGTFPDDLLPNATMCGIWTYFGDDARDAARAPALFGACARVQPRGPDNSVFEQIGDRLALGFHRLAIMDLSVRGDQPFALRDGDRTVYALCNGEIYNYRALIEEYDLPVTSASDCEVIPLLFLRIGFEAMVRRLEGEFAIVLAERTPDGETLYAARDAIGVRPLFWARTAGQGAVDSAPGGLVLASELKGLASVAATADVFPPGHTLTAAAADLAAGAEPTFAPFYGYDYPRSAATEAEALVAIRERFTQAVEARLHADRAVGALLSGGLDSSLVCGVAARLMAERGQRLRTFTIGFEGSPDVRHARLVAAHIGSDHREFLVTEAEAIAALRPTARAIESFDITTVRASTWQWLLGKRIAETTDVRVLLTGEGADEVASGYLYFHAAPSPEAMHDENVRLVRDIHRFDGLRVDRAMACHGLEVRIPMLDPAFVGAYLAVDPVLRMPRALPGSGPGGGPGVEKHLLREAFAGTDVIPEAVRTRTKSAFSDGTSRTERSWVGMIGEHVAATYGEVDLAEPLAVGPDGAPHVPPPTAEARLYRRWFQEDVGERFSHVIPYLWMPRWVEGATDPSARTLALYRQMVAGDN